MGKNFEDIVDTKTERLLAQNELISQESLDLLSSGVTR